MKKTEVPSYAALVWAQYKKSKIGMASLLFLVLFALIGLYAPLFAASKPLFVMYQGKVYFPLFRYLFYTGYYTKNIDLFYNLLMFIFPLFLVLFVALPKRCRKGVFFGCAFLQAALFLVVISGVVKDPQSNLSLALAKREVKQNHFGSDKDPLLSSFEGFLDWEFEKKYLNEYAKLNLLLRYKVRLAQHEKFAPIAPLYEKAYNKPIPTLHGVEKRNIDNEKKRLLKQLEKNKEAYDKATLALPTLQKAYRPFSKRLLLAKKNLKEAQERLMQSQSRGASSQEITLRQQHINERQQELNTELKRSSEARIALEEATRAKRRTLEARSKLKYLQDREDWLQKESHAIKFVLFPLVRPFHWEDDAGGQQNLNKLIPWYERTRINRKDLVAGLIFGVRISLVVGVSAVALSLLIGVPIGMISGFFAGKVDIITFRLIEVWEAMPTFFMLLLVVAILQSKSIFLVVGVLGIFGWTGFARFMRGEVLKQRKLPYVLASKNLGYKSTRVMFSEILPNSIAPILTLLPFSMMAAITSEAGLSFLGLGEEGSTSWGVLMAEGRSVFPGESYLLWPPAILLTLLLVAIALVGDTFRDAIDPKLRT